jgi:hypothetical protein
LFPRENTGFGALGDPGVVALCWLDLGCLGFGGKWKVRKGETADVVL